MSSYIYSHFYYSSVNYSDYIFILPFLSSLSDSKWMYIKASNYNFIIFLHFFVSCYVDLNNSLNIQFLAHFTSM
jgi:hypothetical protein